MGKKQSFVIAGLFGGLLTYGASQLVGWSDESTPESRGAAAVELRRLREQVRKLEGSVASSDRIAREAQETAQAVRAVASQRLEVPPTLARGSEPNTQDKSDEGLPAKTSGASSREPSPQEIVDQMDSRFFSEGLDPAWNREARPRAERFGVMLPQGTRVVSLECRRSMCRLEMSYPSLESFQGFIQQNVLRGEHNWNGPIMTTLKGDPQQPGELQAVAYLAREGVDLSPTAIDSP